MAKNTKRKPRAKREPKAPCDKPFRIRLYAIRDECTNKILCEPETIIIMGYTTEYIEPGEDKPGSFTLLRADATTAYTNPDSGTIRDCVALDAIKEVDDIEKATEEKSLLKLIQ